jgi:crooked neck
LLREAQEYKETSAVPPRQEITDPAELKEYQGRKRKEFEDGLRRNRQNMGLWTKYAAWEAKMGDFARSRSVYERALDVDYRNQSMWLRYADMEMRNKQIAHARNIWDRAVGLMPRIDQFWYKYAYMEEMMGEIGHARTIFERWMTFHPNEQAWLSYIKLEIRHNNIERAR